tara:strand:+ start:452 stop:1939 length:1488 start_codon:yes stop_codon:yes gene_type:complete
MIWLLVRAGLFVALAAAVAYGIGVLLDTPGGIEIVWDGRAYSFDPLTFVAIFLGTVLALWLLWKLIGLLLACARFLSGDETAVSRFFGRSRTRRGLEALEGGMIAMAEGDPRRALAKAERAGKLLDRPELAELLAAQAARAAGQEDRAEVYFKALARTKRTQAIGVRGLLDQAMERGETAKAQKLAERAFALRPRDAGVMTRLFDLQTGAEDWAAARRTLAAEVRAGALPREVGARRDAVLALAEARVAEAQGDHARAQDAALEANRRSPALAPAAVAAARALAAQKQVSKAERVLRQAWKTSPHPEIAGAFAALVPDESPEARRRRFKGLTAENPDHPESQMLEAELALADEDFPGARRALGNLTDTRPTTRSLAIMAAVERGSGADDHVVRAWLAKALSAPRGEAWTCDACGHVHEAWTPVCEECRAVDSLSWKQPSGAGETSAAQQALLPVILASLEGRAAAERDIPEAAEDAVEGQAEPAPAAPEKGAPAA